MTLELGFRRYLRLPDWIQTGNGEPRKAHFLGKKEATPVEKPDQGRNNDNAPQDQDTGKYRKLTSIRMGEVDDAMRYFMSQLVASPAEGWVARNYFCQLPVRQQTEQQSPLVFGRVRTAFPSDGNVHNIKQMEMYFPNAVTSPDLLLVRRSNILLQDPIYSYCVGVKMYLSEAEVADFSQSENIFVEKGFAPIYEDGYIDLLDLNEHNHSSRLWLNVIGSEWFASIPDSVQPEIRERLRDLADWNKVILNYHPRRHSLRYLSLNDELDFNYEFTRHYLLTPQDTNQTLLKLEQIFEGIFIQGMS
ncbi:MAG TPA: hypothetical protein VJ785_19190 [Anaerolineales bacterium]|nr:hypothetical protein [Anaerolineales bacterium]